MTDLDIDHPTKYSLQPLSIVSNHENQNMKYYNTFPECGVYIVG